MHAYVLVQTWPGTGAQVSEKARRIQGITAAEDVAGPFDIIIRAETADLEDLTATVVPRLAAMDGVIRTMACPIIRPSDDTDIESLTCTSSIEG